ncbi:hypothetical protein DACRYDRAFT_22628 [Dacryopinax primogenitus]|uniref:Uncharacterized protein n=1 Tax=Dacryopinax primogenitus (strain DJM 731) TaxID=1858805 RepID=M5G6R3_DACPD|nr:uncharacterized protein DACRYDRAFT_22628 [Dacryopinax primogenitus]EJU01512.1 hypothetical protein DACRYDRAFT_22628 [Dacryopinax primogenitus]
MHRLAVGLPLDPLKPRFQLQSLVESVSQHMPSTPKAAMAVEAIRALSKDKLKKKYVAGERTLYPPSYPMHYERLAEGVENANKGIARPWWKRFFGIW